MVFLVTELQNLIQIDNTNIFLWQISSYRCTLLLTKYDVDQRSLLQPHFAWFSRGHALNYLIFLKAGIRKESLTIALEPEAASIYCQYLKFANEDTLSPTLGVVKPGTKYMLVDFGGEDRHSPLFSYLFWTISLRPLSYNCLFCKVKPCFQVLINIPTMHYQLSLIQLAR